MKASKLLIGGCLSAAFITALPVAQAAYPKTMEVIVEVWNDGRQHLHMTHASWIPDAVRRDDYQIDAEHGGRLFDVTLRNPRNDAATFRYGTEDGKVCQFKMGHEARFSWFGLNPTPSKTATAKSVGTVAAQCHARVTKGINSLESYSVRFSMK